MNSEDTSPVEPPSEVPKLVNLEEEVPLQYPDEVLKLSDEQFLIACDEAMTYLKSKKEYDNQETYNILSSIYERSDESKKGRQAIIGDQLAQQGFAGRQIIKHC